MCVMKFRRYLAIIACSVLTIVLVFYAGFEYSQHLSSAHNKAIAGLEDANVSYMALLSLRNYGTNEMIHGMEGTLDRGVIDLWRHRDSLTRQEWASALQLLKNVKAYRKKYPRRINQQPDRKAVQTNADSILSAASKIPPISGE